MRPATKRDTLTYRFVLSDAEFGRAWLREYYRRPGWRLWRVIGGPCFVALGFAMSRSAEPLTMGMGIASIAFGIFYAVRPWMASKAMVAHRRKGGRSGVEIQLSLHRGGIRIDDGKVQKEIAWEHIASSGETPEYVWYELAGGNRATIPLRVVDDVGALREKLAAHTKWAG